MFALFKENMPLLTADDIACITDFFNYVDTDHSGFITPAEIEAACEVDIDGNGTISDAEIVQAARPWIDAFAAQDLNNDYQISLPELLAYNAA